MAPPPSPPSRPSHCPVASSSHHYLRRSEKLSSSLASTLRLLIPFITLVYVHGQMQPCRPVIGGQPYDLSALEGPVFITVGPENPAGFKYVYQLQLCRDISKPMIPQCEGSVCQYMNSGNEYLYMASVSSWSRRPYPVWSYINPSDPSEGIVLTSENGGMCGSSGFRRQMNFFFNCSASRPTSIQVLSDSISNCPAPGLSCCYNFQITTHLACPNGDSSSSSSLGNSFPSHPVGSDASGQSQDGDGAYGGSGDGGGTIVNPGFRMPPQYQYPGGGEPGVVDQGDGSTMGQYEELPEALGTGWWFVYVVMTTLGLYIGIGCVYNMRTRNVSGIDAFPHLSFWREVPGLVRDGCSVSRSVFNRILAMLWCRRLQYREVN